MSRSEFALSVAALAILGFSGSATAALSYSTSFESPFITGTLAGQQGWVTSAVGGSSAFSVVNTAGQARTGTQAVSLNTASTSGGFQWTPLDQTAGDLADSANSVVRASVWVNLFSAAVGTTRTSFAGLDCYDITGSARLAFIRVSSSGFVQINNGGTSTLQAAITGFTLNQWNKVTIELDYGADQLRWYFNDIQITPTSGYDVFTGTTFGDADLYAARQSPATGAAGGHTLLWDDYSVVTVPAPGAIALLGLAGLAGRRRR